MKQVNEEEIDKIVFSGKGLKQAYGLRAIKNINTLDLRFNQLQNVEGLRGITTINKLDLKRNRIQNV